MDMVVLFLDNGILKSSGDYFSSGYTVPSKDDSQDWHVDKKEAKVVDGKVHLKFSRSLETDDKSNDRSLDGCVLFQFAANLGKYGSRFGIRKHEDWPDLYKACGIKEHCSSTKKPRFAQAKDEAVENVQSVENSGEEPEEKFTTTEVSPVEMVDASVTAQNGTAAPVRSALEEDSLLTSAETPAVPSSEAPSTEASSAPTEASTTSEIPATSEITTVTIQAQDLITAVTEASTEPSTEASTVGNVVEEAATEPTASETQPEASTTAETTETEATAPSTTAVKKECEEGHEDLTVCQSYIDDYFGEVKEWAQKHNETLDAQRWKACSLLQKVPHVPNLCCTSYLDVCRNHLPQTQLQTGTI
ncbi:hypothetical protein L596_029078 [Steinernema carpocapsae]|nr:hypothetical protein L596_029078 [Steinernema carpocapsae]